MFTTSHVDLDRVLLHYGEAGPADGTPVLFLHGWPDLWFTWEDQMRPLAQRGYRVIAPDQRGYGRSSKPPHVSDYRLEVLAEDIAQLIARLELGRVHIVGHDWGGAVAWWLALTRPDLLRSLTVVNSPHPWVFLKFLLTRPTQLLRIWYMFMFQIPGLAERVFAANDSAVLCRMMEHGAHVKDPAKLQRYREQWRNPGAVRLPLYWYRAMFRFMLRSDPRVVRQPVRVPTMLFWGDKDFVFHPRIAQHSIERCVDGRLHHFDTAHWPFHEQPELFARLLQDFLEQHALATEASPPRPVPTLQS